MVTALIVFSSKEPKHAEYIRLIEDALKEYCKFSAIDMNAKMPLHEIFYKIRDSKAKLIITFDCAGFELRSETDATSLNLLTGRVAHLLFKNPDAYGPYLMEELNLNHFTYIDSNYITEEFISSHTNLPYIGSLPKTDAEALKNWFSKERNEMEI